MNGPRNITETSLLVGSYLAEFRTWSLQSNSEDRVVKTVQIELLIFGFEVLAAVTMKSSIPCIQSRAMFGGAHRLRLQDGRVRQAEFSTKHAPCLVCSSSTLKLIVICSSEISVVFDRTAWHYISEDRILQTFKYLHNIYQYKHQRQKVVLLNPLLLERF
jgi:hypothetical protein